MTSEPVPVTREGLERLRVELAHLREVRRPEIAAIVAEARSHGDLRENSAYDAARHDQMMNERRIADLDSLFRNAVIVDDKPAANGVVGLGSTVTDRFRRRGRAIHDRGRDRGQAHRGQDLESVADRCRIARKTSRRIG